MTNQGAWTNQVVSLIILTEAATGFSGLFGYNPSPAAGNLIFSVAAAAGTDPYGNKYLAGAATYNNAIQVATVLNAGEVAFYSGTLAGGWTFQSLVTGDVAGNVQINAAGQLQLIGGTNVTIQGSANVGNPNPNSTSSNGLTDGSIINTSGPASAGTAHTHSAGSYHVSNAAHVHDLQNHVHPL